MEPYMLRWQETASHAVECADFLKDCRAPLEACSRVCRYLQRDYMHRHGMAFGSDDGTSPWREVEAALRDFARANPTDSLGERTARIAAAFAELKSRFLDAEEDFKLYIMTTPDASDAHRGHYRFLVEFKTRLLVEKATMEDCLAEYMRALFR